MSAVHRLKKECDRMPRRAAVKALRRTERDGSGRRVVDRACVLCAAVPRRTRQQTAARYGAVVGFKENAGRWRCMPMRLGDDGCTLHIERHDQRNAVVARSTGEPNIGQWLACNCASAMSCISRGSVVGSRFSARGIAAKGLYRADR